MNIMRELKISFFIFMLSLPPIYGHAQLTQITNSEINEYYPRWSPDGKTIAFTKYSQQIQGIWLVSDTGGTATSMNINLRGDFHTTWSPDGLSIAFDANDNNGILQIWTIPVTGSNPVKLTNFGCGHPAWSPDGSKIAVTSNRSGNWDIWVMPVTGGAATQITSDPAEDWHANWSPDGSQIAFTSDRSGNNDIWTIPAAGGTATQITINSAWDDSPSWSSDGSKIAFESNRSGNFDIWTICLNDRTTVQVTSHESDDRSPDWSSDGSKIVFISQRTRNYDVWLIDIPATHIENKEYSLPDNFGLWQNYPNPFNSSTNIRFELLKSSEPSIKIYDIQGKLIRLLSSGQMWKPGSHVITWNGMDEHGEIVGSGQYFLKIKLGKFSEIKKMLFLK